MKKYDFSMARSPLARPPFTRLWRAKKKNTLLVTRLRRAKKTPSFYKTFVKKAQWRAKKLRERGSNAARQPKKGGGGLPIRSQSVAIRSRFGRDSVVICGLPLGVSRRFASFHADSVVIGRDSVAIGRDSVAIRSRFADFLLAFRVVSCRFGRDSVAIRSRFGRNRSQSVAIRRADGAETEDKTPKTSRKLDFVF